MSKCFFCESDESAIQPHTIRSDQTQFYCGTVWPSDNPPSATCIANLKRLMAETTERMVRLITRMSASEREFEKCPTCNAVGWKEKLDG